MAFHPCAGAHAHLHMPAHLHVSSLRRGSCSPAHAGTPADVNKAVKMLKEKAELTVKIRAIEPDKLAWGVISDASFGNAHQGHSQGAYAVMAFDEGLKDGLRVPCSLISWRSGRIQKVVNSTLAAETQSRSSLSKGLGELCWIVTLFNELMDASFELAEWKRKATQEQFGCHHQRELQRGVKGEPMHSGCQSSLRPPLPRDIGIITRQEDGAGDPSGQTEHECHQWRKSAGCHIPR